MRRLRPYFPKLLPLFGYLILPILLYANVTFGGQTMLPVDNLFVWQPWASYAGELGVGPPHNGLISDLILQNYVWKSTVRDALFSGDIPLWNPNLFAGVPFLAAGQHSAYYPFSALFLTLPLPAAYGWYALSQIWLAGVLMFVYGRILHLNRPSAFIAGLVFQGCGTLVISTAVFPMVAGAMVWLPLLLGCIDRIIGDWGLGIGDRGSGTEHRTLNTEHWQSKLGWLFLGAIALGVQILAGHIEYTIYTLLVMGLYAGWRLFSNQFSVFSDQWRRREGREERGEKNSQQSTANSQRLTDGQPPIHNSQSTIHNSQFVFFRRLVPLATKAAMLIAMVALGMMLGGIQLIPLYELGQVNFREASATLDEVRGYGFEERRVLTLLLPDFFGNPTDHSYRDPLSGEEVLFEVNYDGQPKRDSAWGKKNHVEGAIYLGILPLILAGLAVVVGWRNGRIQFFVLLAAASLGFIFGTPLYAVLFYGLPFVNQLHTPFRWVFPLSVCVAVLAGYGAQLLTENKKQITDNDDDSIHNSQFTIHNSQLITPSLPRSLTTKLAKLTSFTTLIAGATALLALGFSLLQYDRVAGLVERAFLSIALATTGFPSAQAFFAYQFWNVLTLGLMLLGSGVVIWVGLKWGKRPFLILAATLIVVDLYLPSRDFHASNDPALVTFEPELIQWLKQQPGQWRLTTYNPNGDNPLNANGGWFYGFEDIRGYDSIIPKQYTTYMAAIEPQGQLLFNRIQPIRNFESLNSPLLDVLNVKFVITSAIIDSTKYQQVWEGDGLRVYENLGVAPRAYTLPQTATVVSDDSLADLQNYDPRQFAVVEIGDWRLETEPVPSPQSPVPILSYSNREIVVETAVSEPSWLILNDSYFPGWNAFVKPIGASDDVEEERNIFKVNGNFRGVILQEGEWSIRFRYSPASFWLGGLTSAMGAILLLFGGLVWAWQRVTTFRVEQVGVLQSLAKNSVAPMFLNLFNKGIDFVFAMYYLRVMGPADSGSFQTAITTAILFEIVSNFGLDILLIRDVSQDREQATNYLANTTILRLGMAVIAAVPILLFVFGTQLLGDGSFTTNEIAAILLIMTGMLFSGMSKGVTGLFYVYEKADVPATMTTVTTILKVAFGVVALLLGYSFVGLAAVSIIVNIITLLLLTGIAFNRLPIRGAWSLNWSLQREIARKGWPLMLLHLLQTVFISIDVLLLRLQLPNTGQTVVGWYSSAYKWFNALQVIPSFFTLALFPIISREIKSSVESAKRMYRMSLKLMLLLALPIAAVTFYLATPLTRLLSGAEFLPHGAIALQLVILSIPFGWLNSVTNYVLIGLGLEQRQPRAFGVAVGFNIVANLIFIPLFTYRAAAVTTILSEIVLLLLFDYYIRRQMGRLDWGGLLIRPFLLFALTFVGLYVGGMVHITVGLLVGLLVYGGGLFLLNIVNADERQLLLNILPQPLKSRFSS